jgi:hypothetical protein
MLSRTAFLGLVLGVLGSGCAAAATGDSLDDAADATSSSSAASSSTDAASSTAGSGGASDVAASAGSGGAPAISSSSSSGGASASTTAGTGGAPPMGCDHPPVNDPTADPTGLEPGPVVKYTVHVYYMKEPDDTVIDPIPSGSEWLVPIGDKVVFDSTQKNADNKICQWQNLPEYILSDPSCAFDRLATGKPFLLQMKAIKPGKLYVSATIDGVTSNQVVVEAIP